MENNKRRTKHYSKLPYHVISPSRAKNMPGIGKGKSKVHPRTGHEHPEGE
jgi:hypothetical protein